MPNCGENVRVLRAKRKTYLLPSLTNATSERTTETLSVSIQLVPLKEAADTIHAPCPAESLFSPLAPLPLGSLNTGRYSAPDAMTVSRHGPPRARPLDTSPRPFRKCPEVMPVFDEGWQVEILQFRRPHRAITTIGRPGDDPQPSRDFFFSLQPGRLGLSGQK